MKKKYLFEKIMVNLAYKEAKKAANETCMGFLYQPELPESVKNLRKISER